MILTAENYFSNEAEIEYMGSTQFKNFMQCEAATMARINGEYKTETTKPMLIGSYVDAHFSHELDLFKAQHPEIFTKQGELKSDFRNADEIIARIEADEMFMAAVSGTPQVIMTGVIGGVKFKIKIDSLHPDRTVDLKVMADFADKWKDGECLPWWKVYGYDIQAAIYREVRYQADGEYKPFQLAAATKQDGTDMGIFEFSDATLTEPLELVKNMAPRFQAIKQGFIEPIRCENCEYCRMTKKLKEIKII